MNRRNFVKNLMVGVAIVAANLKLATAEVDTDFAEPEGKWLAIPNSDEFLQLRPRSHLHGLKLIPSDNFIATLHEPEGFIFAD